MAEVAVPVPPPPSEHRERQEWISAVAARDARERCGISASTVARALGVDKSSVCHWEKGHFAPKGTAGAAYARVVAGMIRHLEVARGYGYPCCGCCEHFEEEYEPSRWRHDEPCPNGCDA